MIRTRTLAVASALTLVSLLAPSAARPARADPPTSAAELKARGDAAMDEGRAAEALDAYLAAARQGERPELTYNVGRARLALGDFVGALDAFERFDRTAPPDLRERVHRLPEVMAELRAKVARLTVRVRAAGASEGPAAARLTLDGAPLTPNVPVRLNPGRHTLAASAKEHAPRSLVVDVRPGESKDVDLTLDPASRPLLARPGFWIAAGGGAVVVAAIVTGLVLATQASPTDGSLGTFTVR